MPRITLIALELGKLKLFRTNAVSLVILIIEGIDLFIILDRVTCIKHKNNSPIQSSEFQFPVFLGICDACHLVQADL